MTGLKSRLESIEGVESIELELGEEGLAGITVRLAEGADEVHVLDDVRRLLVAYGTGGVTSSRLGSPAPVGAAVGQRQAESPLPTHQVIDVDEAPSEMVAPQVRVVSSGKAAATMLTPGGERVEISITPAGDRSTTQVVYARGDRTLRRQVPSSARGIVQAVLDMAAEAAGREPISLIGLNLSAIEGMRVLTVIAGNEGETPRVSTVSVIDSNWPAALLEVTTQILEERAQPD
ncbi:MAG: hypothetical protein ACLFWM_03390 [Actinomycetota bacterium]